MSDALDGRPESPERTEELLRLFCPADTQGRYWNDYGAPLLMHAADTIAALRAENARLREALRLAEQKTNALRDDLIDDRTAEIDASDMIAYAGCAEDLAAGIRAALSGSAVP